MVRKGLKNNLHNFDRLDEGDGGVNQSRQMNQIFLRGVQDPKVTMISFYNSSLIP